MEKVIDIAYERIYDLYDEFDTCYDKYRLDEINDTIRKWRLFIGFIIKGKFTELNRVTPDGKFEEFLLGHCSYCDYNNLLNSLQNCTDYYGTPDPILLSIS